MLGVISDHTNMILLHLQLNASLVNIRIFKTYVKGWHKRTIRNCQLKDRQYNDQKKTTIKKTSLTTKQYTKKTKEWIIHNHLKKEMNESEVRCSGRESSSSPTSGTWRVTWMQWIEKLANPTVSRFYIKIFFFYRYTIHIVDEQ